MASTNKYNRRELDDLVFTALEAGGDSPAKILGDWVALRAKLQATGLADPGAMSEADLFAMFSRMESAEEPRAIDGTTPVLAFKMRGANEFEPFEYYGIIDGTEPPYEDEWPVLAVDAATGAVKAAIPRELVPYLDPKGLQLTVGVEVVQLTPEWLKEPLVSSSSALSSIRPVLGTERTGSPVGAPDTKTTVPTATAQVSVEVVQSLLARRRTG